MKSILSRPAGLFVVAASLAVAPVTLAQNKPDASKPAATDAADAKGAALKLKDPVATVNGEKISKAELEKAFNQAIEASGMRPEDLSMEQKLSGYGEILDELIVDKLVAKAAEKLEVKDDEVVMEISKIKANFPSEEVFKQEMTRMGETDESMKTTIKRVLQQRRWMETQLAGKDKVGDDDAKKFYDTNQEEFKHPPLVRASHILIRIPEGADDKVIAEKKAAAVAALARVKKGEDFAAVAKELSEEPGAKETGGDLNFFPKERMVPEFADAAFKMKEGEVSEPVQTKFGWHVIKVTGKKDAGVMPFDEVKEQVVAYLQGSKRRDAIKGVIDGLRSGAKIENTLPSPAVPSPKIAPGGN